MPFSIGKFIFIFHFLRTVQQRGVSQEPYYPIMYLGLNPSQEAKSSCGGLQLEKKMFKERLTPKGGKIKQALSNGVKAFGEIWRSLQIYNKPFCVSNGFHNVLCHLKTIVSVCSSASVFNCVVQSLTVMPKMYLFMHLNFSTNLDPTGPQSLYFCVILCGHRNPGDN